MTGKMWYANCFTLVAAAAFTACGHSRPAASQVTDVTDQIARQSEGTPKGAAFSLKTAPAIPSLREGGFAERPEFEDRFDPGWPGQTQWQVATWKQNGTEMSPERCRVDADGFLVQTVLPGEPFRGGSLQTRREFGYGRWVARLKPSSVPGVLNSMFTKDWDNLKTEAPGDGGKSEVDIELLSHTFRPGRGEVHLAIHLQGRPNLWSEDVPLDFNPSDDFHEWGFDILPDRVVWHVDGRFLREWRYTEEHRVDPDYEFFFNSWTRQKWIKGPPAEKADYRVDWVRFHPWRGPAGAAAPR